MAIPHLHDMDTDVPNFLAMTDDLEKQSPTSSPSTQHRSSRPNSPSSSTTARPRTTAHLDGLRGLAALMVYMSHHIPWFYGFDNSVRSLERGYGDGSRSFAMLPFIRVFFTGGSAAVAIFFVLSGYVLSRGPLQMLREGQRKACYSSLLSATVRRPFRLFLPAAGVSLAFACVMQLPFGMAPRMTWPEAKANLGLQLLNWADEFWRVLDPFEAHGIAVRWFPYDPPLWTIAIEFRGSIIVFALVAAFSRVGTLVRAILFGVTGLVLLFAYEWSMFCFMAGVVLAINDQEGYDSVILRRCSTRLRSAISVGVLLLGWWLLGQPGGKREPERAMKAPGWYYVTMLVPGNYWRQEYWRFWHAWGGVLLVYGVLKVRLAQHFFNTKYLRFLGKVSFSLYLTHIPFLWTVGDRIYRIFGSARMDFKTGFDDLVYIPDLGPRGLSTRFLISQYFILSLNLLLAYLCTTWLDEPSLKFGRWLSGKVVSKSSTVNQKSIKEVRNVS